MSTHESQPQRSSSVDSLSAVAVAPHVCEITLKATDRWHDHARQRFDKAASDIFDSTLAFIL